jgi:hypothetical protein
MGDGVAACARILASPSPTGTWLLKRGFGFAGRGQRRVSGTPSDEDLRWIAASIRRDGGLAVEPLVTVTLELATHGIAGADGSVVLGATCVQRCDENGAWIESRFADDGDLASRERHALVEEARRVGAALVAAGYFGPFGVDAFRWQDPAGADRLQARSEINARYTMGWSLGMARERTPVTR